MDQHGLRGSALGTVEAGIFSDLLRKNLQRDETVKTVSSAFYATTMPPPSSKAAAGE